MKYWDISLEISPGMTAWPGHPPVVFDRYRSMEKGDSANTSALSLQMHAGTHVDAPIHFVPDAPGADRLPLDVLIGPVRVVELQNVSEIRAADLERLALPAGTERILFKTLNSQLWKNTHHEFVPTYVALATDAAEWLVKRGVKLVGVDYLSVQKFRDPNSRTHHVLLEARVVVVEGLNLAEVPPGEYQLICLPLKLKDADGAPARAVLIDRKSI